MNIKDYAKDVNLSVAEVLRKCNELGIKADGNSILSDDDIIMIDNTINLMQNYLNKNLSIDRFIIEMWRCNI